MKNRICGTCAFGGEAEHITNGPWEYQQVLCHYEPISAKKHPNSWCRHWSETTGWDRFEEMPSQLEQAAFEIFQRLWGGSGNGPAPEGVRAWLEEYTRKC